MKKILFTALLFVAFSAKASVVFNERVSFQTAETVKLGVMAGDLFINREPRSPLADGVEPTGQLAVQCGAGCQSCDTSNGVCSECIIGRYLSEGLCPICPQKHWCDGQTAIPNCTDVSCFSTAFAEATDTGCCCVSHCTGVVCNAGYAAKPNASGCCCS